MNSELRSLVFTEWNKARAAAVNGKLDQQRTNKALGLMLSGKCPEKFSEYGTTYRSCGCPDAQQRRMFCKHRIAFVVMLRVYERVQLIWLGEYQVVKSIKVRNHKVADLHFT